MYPKPVVPVDVVAAVGVPVIVPFMVTVDVPEVAPIFTAVVPEDAPVPMFSVFVPVVAPVTKLAVTVDVVPAMVSVVAAAPIVMVVGVANKARVAALELIVPAFRFMVEVETAGLPPMFITVVPAVPAPVPMFNVFVETLLVAPVAKL